MKYQGTYNSPTSFALLQSYLEMMDGNAIDYDYFLELTGFTKRVYIDITTLFKNLVDDLHLTCHIQRLEEDIITSKTKYHNYRYILTSRIDYSFILDDDLPFEKKKMYLPTIIFLKLKNKQFVTLNELKKYFPEYEKRQFMITLTKLREILGDIYKDEYKSYVLESEE